MDGNARYFAFISYKREDEEWAKWLQHMLEHYKLPSNLNGRTDLPKEIRPVFKDTSELNPGNLPQQIHDALEQSRYLIVICSPRSAKSEWVNREVESFINMGRMEKIIPFIIEGSAFSKNPEAECFPQALRNIPAEQEILGANINEMGRDAAVVKVVAQMFGLRFDELWQRYEREQRRKRRWMVAASIAGFLIMAGVAFWMYAQRQQTLRANWQMMENQARFIAEKAQDIIDEGDSYTAQRLLLEVLPVDLMNPNRPLVQEAEYVFREAANRNNFILKHDAYFIRPISFSYDDKYILSTHYDNISIWDVEDGTLKSSIETEQGDMVAAFSPDGKHAVFASYRSGKPTIWDIENMKEIPTVLDTLGAYTTSIIYSPDGRCVASVSHISYYPEQITIVRIWELETGSLLKSLKLQNTNEIVFSHDGNYMISSGKEGIGIWYVNTFSIKKNILDAELIAVSLNSNTIAYLIDTSLCIYNIDTEDCKLICDGTFLAVVFGIDDRNITLVDSDEISVYDVESGSLIKTKEAPDWLEKAIPQTFSSITISHEGNRIAIVNDHTINICNIEQSSHETILEDYNSQNNNTSNSFGFNCNSIVMACEHWNDSISEDTTYIGIWDSRSGALLKLLKGFDPDDKVICLMHSANGRFIAAVIRKYGDDVICIWDAESGLFVKSLPLSPVVFVNSVDISSEGNTIATLDEDGHVEIWDVSSTSLLNTINVYCDYFSDVSVTFSPDGRCIAVGDYSKIGLWDITTGELVQSFGGHQGKIAFVSFSPNGKYIISSNNDNALIIWDIETGNPIHTIIGDAEYVFSAVYSTDSRCIVSAYDDNTVRVWDVVTGALLQTFIGHGISIYDATFTSDGKQVVVWDGENIVRYDFPHLQDLIDQARERFKNRPLTNEERRMYYLE